MEDTKLTISSEIGYNSLTFPDKIVLPFFEGKIGGFSYEQHPTDPLSFENLEIGYAGENRIKLTMRGTGRIKIKNMPDLKIGGTKIHVETDITLEEGKFRFLNPELVKLDFPNFPNFADKMLRDVFNRNLLATLKEDLKIDLQGIMADLRSEMNKPIKLKLNSNKTHSKYFLELNLNPIEPEFHITLQAIILKLYVTLKPVIKPA